jgi:hypothetical protein
MSDLIILGYVIASRDGMLADATGVMPDSLKFPGDQQFFSTALDDVDVIVHGRNSFEDQPNSPQRKRIIVTRQIEGVAADPSNCNATLWNPASARFEQALAHAGVTSGKVAIIGGPIVFGMFMNRFDVFWLSEAAHVQVPNGQGCFPGVPEKPPQDMLASHGLSATETRVLDAANDVTVTAWRRI